ncbi:MAG: leucine-rich repeat protein [Bacteroides sp.]|nr:leucine-rich repeat protein [Bacteroides sp.]
MSIKRCIWGLLTAVLVSISNPLDASAKDFVYNYLGVNFKCKVKNGKTTIIAFDRDAAEVKIPAEVRDKHNISYQVSMISLFSEATYYKATTVVIERGITEIDEYCFQYFKELNAIYIPNSVEKIGKKAFNPKYAPTFTMPGSIKESDLLAGNAVYPQNTPIQVNPTEGLDLSDYTNESEGVKPKGGINMNFQLEQGVAITPGTSDIDRDIPFGKQKRENTFCIIIANEDYTQKDTPGVKYAMQDGKTFQNYCYRTLGLPRNNVRFVGNASYLQTKELLRWLQQVAEVYGTDANFLVYYAGHGVPDEKGNCKLIPADVSINDVHNGIALKELYDTLGTVV